jgi:hypothetical protein
MGKLILILLVVLGASMAIPTTRAKMVEAATPVMNKFKAKLVPDRLDALANELAARLKRGEGYPGDWSGWLRGNFSGVPEDPWGNLYYLTTDRTGFTVGSNGPDGIAHTPDDITVQHRLK